MKRTGPLRMPKKKDRGAAIADKPLMGHETDCIYSYCRMGKTEMAAIANNPLTGHEIDCFLSDCRRRKTRMAAIAAKPLTGHETDCIYSYCRMGKTGMAAIADKPLTGHETDRPSPTALEVRPGGRAAIADMPVTGHETKIEKINVTYGSKEGIASLFSYFNSYSPIIFYICLYKSNKTMRIRNRRAPFLDYKKPGIFMITINKLNEAPLFSSIVTNGNKENPRVYVRTSSLGKIIQFYINNFEDLFPGIEIRNYIIMPDHIHFILYIKEHKEEPLGNYLAKWKRAILHTSLDNHIIPPKTTTIFEIGFNDLFLRKGMDWKVLKNYIDSNPYRLWVRFEHPEFFRRVYDRRICESNCSLYGNLQLLDNPFKYQVVVHRADLKNTEIIRRKREVWSYVINNGGILVGAFISNKEKEIFDEAIGNEGRIILIKNHGYDEREKPHGKIFEICEKGKMLIISPNMEQILGKNRRFRDECLFMNEFAEKICGCRL